jgi:hypothetical protein
MIEKNINPAFNYKKKMTAYIDGSLSPEEHSEFEAFLKTHPDIDAEMKSKRDELNIIKSFLPKVHLSHEVIESLESEMKESIFNLLKEEPKNFGERLKMSWEEWRNR